MPFVVLDKRRRWRDNVNLRDAFESKYTAAPKTATIDYRYGRRRARCQGADMELGRNRYQFDIVSAHVAHSSLPPRSRERTRGHRNAD
jgi:hypothetical protein